MEFKDYFSRIKYHEEEKPIQKQKAIILLQHKSNASIFIKLLSYKFPLPQHLKRVKIYDNEKIYILITTLENQNITEIEKELIEIYKKCANDVFYEESKECKLDIQIIDIPITQPYTKKQFLESNEIWPTNFYPRKEEIIDKEYVINTFKNILSDIYSFKKNFNLFDIQLPKNKNKIEKYLHCSGFGVLFNYKDFKEGKKYKIYKDSKFITEHSIFKAIRDYSYNTEEYLCTDMDIFLVKEPCISCAMALIHGRIKRVFYLLDSDIKIFSKHKLQYRKELNHKYTVYKLNNEK
ncbi:Nucleoside deaminase [Spraguea lophii 42_110]|uniref:Nucleoside deaminase n=1 Tax=Spraguea lophii (strain 42_110) TaxID=1358809 RepID=S7XLJ1_SPRLO|nr:Nucleoside deaminase [Spraguea lophii 42_110]